MSTDELPGMTDPFEAEISASLRRIAAMRRGTGRRGTGRRADGSEDGRSKMENRKVGKAEMKTKRTAAEEYRPEIGENQLPPGDRMDTN